MSTKYFFMWHFNNMGWGWGTGIGWIMMIIFWGLIIWSIIYLVRSLSGRGGSRRDNFDRQEKLGGWEDSAVKILRDRYAKGEISKEEYQRMKNDLK